jgi:outer membrane protein assembly factor BamB
MRGHAAWGWGLVLGAGLLAPAPARALITRLTPLSGVLAESQFIFTAKVEGVSPDRPAMVLRVDEGLKGKAPFTKMAVNLKGDAEAAKGKQVPQLLKRVAVKLSLVLFVNERGKHYVAFAYSNGTWFQMTGVPTDDGPRWAFTHFEPYLRKTFKGTTAELRQVVIDGLSGKKAPPAPDKKEKPGIGPEVTKTSSCPTRQQGKAEPLAGASGWDVPARRASEDCYSPLLALRAAGPPFAVIPTVLVGGPLAILAMLFPAVFCGLILVLRRWMAALTVLSVNSTLYLVHQSWLAPRLLRSSWGTPEALWLSMAVVTLLGALWAWHRQAASPTAEAPRRTEVITLVVLSLLSLTAGAYWLPHELARLDLWGKTLVMYAGGLWAATLHALYRRWLVRKVRPGLPGEGVMLWAMMLTATVLGVTFTNNTTGAGTGGTAQGDSTPYRVVWRFPPNQPSWIASSPLVNGGRVYVGAVHGVAFRSGAVYCLDTATGEVSWSFNDGGQMKDVFSSPCLADGRLYIGEGFHQDAGCKLYCLDAETGRKLWDFPTRSHTEATPCVAGGKVYCGAGDDGLYCLDAETGQERWHLKGLHVDANPVVVGGRVYGGSGVGDEYKETALFCLDAETGKERWRMPTDLAVWGRPAVNGGFVYAGLGNGNFLESAARPAGAVLCLEAATGKRLWRYDVADAVLTRVAADGERVYFGSRDGSCYAVERKEGKLAWKVGLGSPVVASPALVQGEGGAALYVLGSAGRVCRLEAATGQVEWRFDVAKDAKQNPDAVQLVSSPCVVTEGERRRVYFGSGLDNFQRGILYCIEE